MNSLIWRLTNWSQWSFCSTTTSASCYDLDRSATEYRARKRENEIKTYTFFRTISDEVQQATCELSDNSQLYIRGVVSTIVTLVAPPLVIMHAGLARALTSRLLWSRLVAVIWRRLCCCSAPTHEATSRCAERVRLQNLQSDLSFCRTTSGLLCICYVQPLQLTTRFVWLQQTPRNYASGRQPFSLVIRLSPMFI